mmetsp:Transcript_100911/g.325758  ORF Transcript_100911/g.325758 Transcript_100911/m.325758 type:complete len:259 (+) Transcript_100911:690-1466(+)
MLQGLARAQGVYQQLHGRRSPLGPQEPQAKLLGPAELGGRRRCLGAQGHAPGLVDAGHDDLHVGAVEARAPDLAAAPVAPVDLPAARGESHGVGALQPRHDGLHVRAAQARAVDGAGAKVGPVDLAVQGVHGEATGVPAVGRHGLATRAVCAGAVDSPGPEIAPIELAGGRVQRQRIGALQAGHDSLSTRAVQVCAPNLPQLPVSPVNLQGPQGQSCWAIKIAHHILPVGPIVLTPLDLPQAYVNPIHVLSIRICCDA